MHASRAYFKHACSSKSNLLVQRFACSPVLDGSSKRSLTSPTHFVILADQFWIKNVKIIKSIANGLLVIFILGGRSILQRDCTWKTGRVSSRDHWTIKFHIEFKILYHIRNDTVPYVQQASVVRDDVCIPIEANRADVESKHISWWRWELSREFHPHLNQISIGSDKVDWPEVVCIIGYLSPMRFWHCFSGVREIFNFCMGTCQGD